jgi:ACS family hexuronate transporter-like MFS transporter
MLLDERAGGRARWGVLALLFLSIAVNLFDRQTLSVLAPLLREELNLSNTEYSYILFSFLLGLTVAQVPAGMWLDRKGPRFGLPILMLWWSTANGLHALARNVTHFCGLRFLLGAGESGNYSAGVKVISAWFPARERALAGGLFNSGTVIGAFAAPWCIVKLSSAFGWRMAFVVPSVLGALWIVPWLLFFRDRGGEGGTLAKTPALSLLRLRPVWGAMLMRALSGPVVHFYWYWLPEYLRRERHFSMETIGLLAGIPFLFAGLGNILGGWFSSALIARGRTADSARKTAFAVAAILCSASMLVPFPRGEAMPVALICLATFGVSVFAATFIGTLADLFPARALASVTGLTGMCEGAANMALVLATGAVVDRFSYLPVFLAAGLMPALAVLAFRSSGVGRSGMVSSVNSHGAEILLPAHLHRAWGPRFGEAPRTRFA